MYIIVLSLWHFGGLSRCLRTDTVLNHSHIQIYSTIRGGNLRPNDNVLPVTHKCRRPVRKFGIWRRRFLRFEEGVFLLVSERKNIIFWKKKLEFTLLLVLPSFRQNFNGHVREKLPFRFLWITPQSRNLLALPSIIGKNRKNSVNNSKNGVYCFGMIKSGKYRVPIGCPKPPTLLLRN